jgi:hypothetical protein
MEIFRCLELFNYFKNFKLFIRRELNVKCGFCFSVQLSFEVFVAVVNI